MDLRGRVAIVTGAGGEGGIGECTARLLAQAGARVVLADLSQSNLEKTTARLDQRRTRRCALRHRHFR